MRVMSSGSISAYREAGAFDCDPEDATPTIKVLHNKEHTARKQHLCDVCEGHIAPGQRYKKAVLLTDGVHSVHKHHVDGQECQTAREAANEQRREADAVFLDAFDAHTVAA